MSTILPPKRIPLGVDNFKKLVDPEYNFLFIDKTLFIQELIDNGAEVTLIIRPRRWGKTLNMSMLQHFFSPTVNRESTQGIFDNLNIARIHQGAYLKYQGKFPVIFISFKDAKKNNFNSFLSTTKDLIQEICNQYSELANSEYLTESEKQNFHKLINKTANTEELCNALRHLSILLNKHYDKKVFILIDEYDAPLNAAYGKEHFEELIYFFKGMFGAALKGNDALEKGILTGILRLSKNNMLSDLNNLELCSLMDATYSHHFGFSETEVHSLFEIKKIDIQAKDIQDWYNGYQAGDLDNIYNPWSILNCMKYGGKLKPYWVKTGDEDLLRKCFLNAGIEIKEKLKRLLMNEPIDTIIDEYCSFDQLGNNEEALWSLLWALGYLKTINTPVQYDTSYQCLVKIPNYEVACTYRSIFRTFMRTLPNIYKYDSFLANLSKGNVEAFIKNLEEYMLTIPSWFDFPQESNYHTFLLGLTASLSDTHTIYSNKEMCLGRPDMLLLPKDKQNTLAIILEFKKDESNQAHDKYEQLAVTGLQQINEKQYGAHLIQEPTIQKILKLCIVFYGKQFICKWALEKKYNEWVEPEYSL
jgi:hypothetical protein